MLNVAAIERLLSVLPDGKKKDKLLAKLKTIKKRANNSKGLHDEFSLSAKGRVKIEKLDRDGNILEVIEQDNLVVNGAEEILLRAFSGDPEHVLYKVRIPKQSVTPTYHVQLDQISHVVDGKDELAYAPNHYWKAVNDNDFEIYYSYRPVTLYLKEVTSSEPGHKAFVIQKNPGAGTVPITSEIYSTYTNMFIGIGDGKHYDVDLNDKRLTFTDFDDEAGKKVATDIGAKLSFKEKISNFKLSFEKSKQGGILEIKVDGETKQSIDTFSPDLTDPVVDYVLIDGLDHTVEHDVEIVFAGINENAESPQKVVITGLAFDALDKSMNSLIHEIENYNTKFDTFTPHNTTTVAPYRIQLEYYPVKKETVVVEYSGVIFSRVDSKEAVHGNSYYVDEVRGHLYFDRPLTNVNVKYNITGEVIEIKDVNSLPDHQITYQTQKKDENGNPIFLDDDGNETTENTGNPIMVTITTTGKKVTLDFELQDEEIRVMVADTDKFLTKTNNEFTDGTFKILNHKEIIIHPNDDQGNAISRIYVIYKTLQKPGVPTNYTRQVIQKPKTGIEYPWFALDKGSVSFVAEFPENVPNYDITLREMILADGPRADDHIDGFTNQPVRAFSIIRIGESRKERNTGLRITWTITLINEDGEPFKAPY